MAFTKEPSWVPNWTGRHSENLRDLLVMPVHNASRETKLSATFRNDQGIRKWLDDRTTPVLEVRGIFVGELTRSYYVATDPITDEPPDGHNDILRRFESSQGHIVTSTRFTEAGDQLWVLYGAASPHILRHFSPDSYRIVSEATLERKFNSDDLLDICGGAMMDLVDNGTVQSKKISIY